MSKKTIFTYIFLGIVMTLITLVLLQINICGTSKSREIINYLLLILYINVFNIDRALRNLNKTGEVDKRKSLKYYTWTVLVLSTSYIATLFFFHSLFGANIDLGFSVLAYLIIAITFVLQHFSAVIAYKISKKSLISIILCILSFIFFYLVFKEKISYSFIYTLIILDIYYIILLLICYFKKAHKNVEN